MRCSSIITLLLTTTFQYLAAQDSSFCMSSGPGEYVDYGGGRSITTLTEARVNIFIHVIRKNDGSGGLSDSQIEVGLQNLRSDFSPFNIHFIETGREYINSNEYYYLSKSDESLRCSLIAELSTENNIDIIFLSPENDPDINGWGYSESIPGKCFIVKGIDDNIVIGTSSVVSHEMGHCLGLFHTFRGANKGTTPEYSSWTNPCTGESFDYYLCRELVDGSNSEFCGDFISDTPADFGIKEGNVDANCDLLTTNRQEPGNPGVYYSPDTRDIMSYSRVDCLEHFTSEQGATMLSTIENSSILSPVIDDEIRLANRSSDSEILLGGALYLDDLSTPGTVEYEDVPSGNEVLFSSNDYYDVGTIQELIQGSKHFNWLNNRSEYLLKKYNFNIPNIDEITAYFKEKINVTFQSPIGFDIYDPWYVDDQTTLHQPDDFVSTTGGVFPMFENQGGTPPALEFPYYTLRAPGEYIIQGSNHYYFQGWRVIPSYAATFTDANALETAVIFQGGDCTVYLDYLNTNALSGHIWTDQNLSGNLNVTGDVIIDGGAVVTLSPGTVVRMPRYKQISVYGELYATGATFTRDDPNNHNKNYWSYIYGRSGSTIYLTDCTLEGSTYGLKGYQADVRAFNTTFTKNTFGLYLRYCDTYYSHDNTFTDNTRGVYLYSSSVPLDNNTFSSNQYGLYALNSSGTISHNTFSGNSTAGIYCAGGTTISLNDWQRGDLLQVNNHIENNGSYGIYIDGSSTPNLGTYQPDPVKENYYYGGFNNFNRGTSGYDIYSLNSATIKAEANWWDTSVLNGNVDTTPTADNVWRGPLFKSTGSDGDNDGPPLPAAILEGDQLAADSLYDDAVSAYQSFISLNPEDDWTLTALGRIVSTAKNAQRDSTWQGSLNDSVLLTILDNLSSSYETEAVGLKALAYSVSVSMTLGNTADALERNSTLINLYTQLEYNDEDLAFALLEQAIIQELIGEESLGKTTAEYSKAGYRKIIDEYPGTIAAHEARILMGKLSGEVSEGMTILTEYALNPAYPNPFNPVTTLSYALPTDSHTRLVIYDLRGRVVRTLVNREETAGQKTLRWDGRNNAGIPVASGVYIYSFTANALNSDDHFTAHRKLVLLK